VKVAGASLGLSVFFFGCSASTPAPAAPTQALIVPAWVEAAGPSGPSLSSDEAGQVEAMPRSARTVVLSTNQDAPHPTGALPSYRSSASDAPGAGAPGAGAPGAGEPRTDPSRAPGSTFFPKEYDAKMFGGCGATDFSSGKCPDRWHDNP
jgi:hypothetical protein